MEHCHSVPSISLLLVRTYSSSSVGSLTNCPRQILTSPNHPFLMFAFFWKTIQGQHGFICSFPRTLCAPSNPPTTLLSPPRTQGCKQKHWGWRDSGTYTLSNGSNRGQHFRVWLCLRGGTRHTVISRAGGTVSTSQANALCPRETGNPSDCTPDAHESQVNPSPNPPAEPGSACAPSRKKNNRPPPKFPIIKQSTSNESTSAYHIRKHNSMQCSSENNETYVLNENR